MPTNFKSIYSITPGIAKSLMRIEASKQKVALLPVNPTVLASLRETAKLYTTHYSTMIEGNQLKPEEIKEVIQLQGYFPGRERDEHEVKGYYAALAQLEQYASTNATLCKKWVEGGFLEIVDASSKARKYKLAEPYDVIVKESL